jgi:hypothetical protein
MARGQTRVSGATCAALVVSDRIASSSGLHPAHFNRRINEWIVDSIASDRLPITADQVEHNPAVVPLKPGPARFMSAIPATVARRISGRDSSRDR